MKKGEIVFSAVCVAFFGFMITQTFELLGQGRSGEMGSGFWPLLVLALAVVLSGLQLLLNIAKYRRAGQAVEKKPAALEEQFKRNRRRKTLINMLLLLTYIVLMPWIGFALSTFLYVFVFIVALGERRKLVLTLSPVLITVAVVLVFSKFISMPLPKGVGVFAAFSQLFG